MVPSSKVFASDASPTVHLTTTAVASSLTTTVQILISERDIAGLAKHGLLLIAMAFAGDNNCMLYSQATARIAALVQITRFYRMGFVCLRCRAAKCISRGEVVDA